MEKCKLCRLNKPLSKSHIIPEFLYSGLYDANHKMIGVTGVGNKGYVKEQKGLRERILCADCEAYINKYMEIPFKKSWVDNFQLPSPWQCKTDVKNIQVDYTSFKLFHLSVLFRASVSTLSTYSDVTLGHHHENKIREMILNLIPRTDNEYPIVGYAITHPETNEIVQMVSKGIASRVNGGKAYGFIYGGMHWWIGVTSHVNTAFVGKSLKSNGIIPIISRKMNEVSLVQETSNALNRCK